MAHIRISFEYDFRTFSARLCIRGPRSPTFRNFYVDARRYSLYLVSICETLFHGATLPDTNEISKYRFANRNGKVSPFEKIAQPCLNVRLEVKRIYLVTICPLFFRQWNSFDGRRNLARITWIVVDLNFSFIFLTLLSSIYKKFYQSIRKFCRSVQIIALLYFIIIG